MKIITPAENPREAARNLFENCFVKRTTALPIVVESPAIIVSEKASQKLPSI